MSKPLALIIFMLQNGETALHKAALEDHARTVKMLIDYGAVVDIKDKVFQPSIRVYI